MDQILQGIPGVQCILDDMIVTGHNESEHLKNLENVLQRLQKFGLRANLEKCEFFKDSVQYCGHEVTKEGIWKTKDKIDAVLKTPAPENVTQLRSFLGLVNYYNRFLPNLASELKPLHKLLEKGQKWIWTEIQQSAFAKAKNLITSDTVLTHYDPNKELFLACDASPYGIGAVLSHRFDDDTERPIAYISKSLTKAERNYAQIDKEALSIYWAVKKFYPYLFGRKFTLITDHQPLTSIFHPSKSIPITSASRLQRYAVFLSGFTYDIMYRNTKKHTNADALSRSPIKSNDDKEEDAVDIFNVSQIENLPVTAKEISKETQRNATLSRVYQYAITGWNKPSDDTLMPFYTRRNEITIQNGCLMWGIRVIIPTKFQQKVLDTLHASHLGVVKMKGIARSYVWWPGIDKEIENITKSCDGCSKIQNNPSKVSLHPWEWPSSPWQRIHIDFAGPFLNQNFLIMVDAHSKWPEVFPMKKITTSTTIEILRTVFARNGIPEQIVSDNGPQFTSREFEKFTKLNGIKHFRSAPYHPATNGLAERFVQTFKRSMKSMKNEEMSLNKKIANFLLLYRNAPHSITNETPELFHGRNLRTCLDLIRPDTRKTVENKIMQSVFEKKGVIREFDKEDHVIVRDYRNHDKWINGQVKSKLGPLTYEVTTESGSVWKRHADQIRDSNAKQTCLNTDPELETAENENSENVQQSSAPQNESAEEPRTSETRRYPIRARKRTKRLIEEY